MQGHQEDSYHFLNEHQAPGTEKENKHLKYNQSQMKLMSDTRIWEYLEEWAQQKYVSEIEKNMH